MQCHVRKKVTILFPKKVTKNAIREDGKRSKEGINSFLDHTATSCYLSAENIKLIFFYSSQYWIEITFHDIFISSMRKTLVLLLVCSFILLGSAEPSLQQSYSFNLNTYPLDPTQAPEYNGMHDLGILSVGQSIRLTINFPNIATFPYSLYLIALIKLLYYNPALSAWTAAFNSASQFPFPYPTSFASSYVATYKVAFPSGSSITSAEFKIFVTDASSIIGYSFRKMAFFSLKVVSFNTTQPSIQKTLVQVSDATRVGIKKVIYTSSDNQVLKLTMSPITNPAPKFPDGISAGNPFVIIQSLPLVNDTLLGSNNWDTLFPPQIFWPSNQQILSPNNPVYVNNVAHYTFNASKKGFYFIQIYKPAVPQSLNIKYTLNWKTDPYACPFSSSYPDKYQIFQGCGAVNIGSAGLPCVNFDKAFGVCTQCLSEYSLVNGSCFANTTCPPRQYFSYGSCLNVSEACGAFDAFTGNCLNCSNPDGFVLENGNCLSKNITCSSNQWKMNYTCINASSLCGTFDPSNGRCLTCASNLYKLDTDGTCSPIVVNCPQGQYAVDLNCLTIPGECLNFDYNLRMCVTCIKGYFLQNATCRRIVCPEGQVPSGFALFCVDVSPLCKDYDPITGDCLTCSSGGYTIREGQCVQAVSPVAGCKEREVLGFGPCVGAEQYCRIFNLITKNCDECKQGYYLDFTGHCDLQATCGVNQWSVNGQCINAPQNCLQVDNLGLCTKCVSDDYRLVQGQCVFFPSCQQRQYLNSAGQCVDVSPNCGTWNPSSGQCITCKDANTQPSAGVCCPAGQVFVSGSCTDLRNSRSLCILPHPLINVCLSCGQDYSPDYTVPYGCSAN